MYSFLSLISVASGFHYYYSTSASCGNFYCRRVCVYRTRREVVHICTAIYNVKDYFSYVHRIHPFLCGMAIALIIGLVRIRYLPVDRGRNPFVFFSNGRKKSFSTCARRAPATFRSMVFQLLRVQDVAGHAASGVDKETPQGNVHDICQRDRSSFIDDAFVIVDIRWLTMVVFR